MKCLKEKNLKRCTCTYEGCPRKGICCECLHFHLGRGELPGCCFTEKGEAEYDRSIENFIKDKVKK